MNIYIYAICQSEPRGTPLGDYENKALFAAEVLFPQDWNPSLTISLDGANDAESAINKLSPCMQPRRMYENYTAFDTVGAVQLTRAALIDSLNKGWGIMHHVGHGFRNSMSRSTSRRWVRRS